MKTANKKEVVKSSRVLRQIDWCTVYLVKQGDTVDTNVSSRVVLRVGNHVLRVVSLTFCPVNVVWEQSEDIEPASCILR